MYGHSAGIDGRHSGRGHDGEPFGCLPHDFLKERCLSRSGLAGQEHGDTRLFHISLRQSESLVPFDHSSLAFLFCQWFSYQLSDCRWQSGT